MRIDLRGAARASVAATEQPPRRSAGSATHFAVRAGREAGYTAVVGSGSGASSPESLPADEPFWHDAAGVLRAELRAAREALGAEWAVLWGPLPLSPKSPFTCVLIEDRDESASSAVGLAVPVAGNRWAEATFAGAGALATDAPSDPRLGLHAPVLSRNKVQQAVSGACLRDGVAEAVVELYTKRAFTAGVDALEVARGAAHRIAEALRQLPKRTPPGGVSRGAPKGDPITAAALHDLKSALSAQSLLVAGFEKELKGAAQGDRLDWQRLGSMLESLAVLRESVMHANELARLMTLGTLAPGSRIAIDLPGLVRLCLAAIPLDLRERFEVVLDPSFPAGSTVREAPALMRAVVSLLQNAALAIQRKPGAHARVLLRSDEEFGYIDVEDEGAGVPSEVLEHLFEPGVTTRDRPDGHGYGLFTAQQAVESIGGTLTLYSVPARGARFTVQLPGALVGV